VTDLPKPLLLTLGILDTARDLPAKALELPMLALSVGLVWRERFQRGYSELVERGEGVVVQVFGGAETGKEHLQLARPEPVRDGEAGVVLDAVSHVSDPLDTPHHLGPEPVPGYASMTLGALRGRLRTLTVPELEELLRYERSGAARPTFVNLLEHRLAKLAAE
jgi:hypothetical protein